MARNRRWKRQRMRRMGIAYRNGEVEGAGRRDRTVKRTDALEEK